LSQFPCLTFTKISVKYGPQIEQLPTPDKTGMQTVGHSIVGFLSAHP